MVLFACTGCNSHPTVTATAQQPTTPRATTTGSTSGTTTSIPSSNGGATAVLPAQFTVNADGSLSPRVVAGPIGTTILLTVTSKAVHPVRVFFSIGRFLTIAPGGHASVRLTGLKRGHYNLYVDGKPRAALVVGAQPGP